MPQPNGAVQLLLTGEPNEMRLQVTDATSHVLITEVTLSAFHFAQLMTRQITGSVDGAPAYISPDLDRIGKYSTNATVFLRTVYNGVGNAAEQALETWASMARGRVQAYSYRINKHNQGRTSVRFNAYHETPEAAETWRSEAQFLLDELRGTAPGA